MLLDTFIHGTKLNWAGAWTDNLQSLHSQLFDMCEIDCSVFRLIQARKTQYIQLWVLIPECYKTQSFFYELINFYKSEHMYF